MKALVKTQKKGVGHVEVRWARCAVPSRVAAGYGRRGRTVAFCDIDEERADKLAAEYGAKAYYCLEELLQDREIDVVTVALPNHLHYDDAVMCSARA